MGWLPWVWAIAGLGMILAEFAVPGLVIFFFGIGALMFLVPVFPLALLVLFIWWLMHRRSPQPAYQK